MAEGILPERAPASRHFSRSAIPIFLLVASPVASLGKAGRRRAVVAVALVGVAAVGANILLGREVVARATGASPLEYWQYYAVQGLGGLALAILSAAAIHRLPVRYRMPELLIGGGAAVAAASVAWRALAMLRQWLVPGEGINWLLAVVPNWIGLAGLLAVMLGFASARIVPPRNSWQRGEEGP